MIDIVVDENVSYGVVEELRELGWRRVHSVAEEHRHLSDEQVFARATKERGILITRDYHFTNPVRFNPKATSGIVYLRYGNLAAEEEIRLIVNFLTTFDLGRIRGRLVTLYRRHLTVR